MIRTVRRAQVLVPVVLLWSGAMAGTQRDVLDRLGKLLPDAVQGWACGPSDDLYDPETIFSYLDGAGEVYRAYNFRHLLSRRYEKKDGPEIIVDLFDMGSPADSFGVNTMDLEGEDPEIGQGGTYKDGLLSFWRDRYFVSVAAESETPETRAACLELGRRIAAAIGKDGRRPALLDALPSGLAPDAEVRYLHSHVILNRHFFVHAENILNLGPTVEVVLARMGERGRDGALLIAKYPDSQAASAAFAGFTAALMPGGTPGSAEGRAADGRGNAARLRGDVVLGALGAASPDAARAVLERAEAGLKQLK
jgi:hypothetical protein